MQVLEVNLFVLLEIHFNNRLLFFLQLNNAKFFLAQLAKEFFQLLQLLAGDTFAPLLCLIYYLRHARPVPIFQVLQLSHPKFLPADQQLCGLGLLVAIGAAGDFGELLVLPLGLGSGSVPELRKARGGILVSFCMVPPDVRLAHAIQRSDIAL